MHELPNLPYKYNELEPHIDEETMILHHTKHHQTYIDKLNDAIKNHEDLKELTVQNLLKNIDKVPKDIRQAVINNGGGHANHSLFWELLTPNSKEEGEVIKAIEEKFGSLAKFKEEFKNSALTRFGSGWAWLVVNEEKELEVMSTQNQDSPLMEGKKPILGLDVWEHAYYKKYSNRRPDYIDAFLNIVNWKQVDYLYKEAVR